MTSLPLPPRTPLSGPARAVALEVLLRGPLPRGELARRLGLSAASLTRLARPLLESGLLTETGPSREPRTGRPTRPLDVVPDAHRFLGVRLTGEEAHAVVTDLRAGVIASGRSALPGPAPEPAAVVATVRGLADQLAAATPGITAAGVSLGGQVRDHAVVTRAPSLGWTAGVPLARLLSDALGLPVLVDNDLLALTRAEHWFGAGRGRDRFAVLTTGVDVGYGLVVHDRVVDGPDAGLGPAAHLPLDPFGPPCPRGHQGCATAMLSVPALCAAAATALRRPVEYTELLSLAEDGNPVALPLVTAAARALGRLIAAVANLTLATTVVLTGEGVGLAGAARAAVDDALRADRDPLAARVELVIRPVDAAAWARGAAAGAIQRHVLGHPS
ncbi:ROK family transcriptional regulator [Streptomyces sp. URMC 129]|uniref:ROK family transcriptional regulator n=1 Tax=Streptomyces sp. URMC 129 TaxID=3423407 RepID=UPI003F19B49F